MWEIKYSKQFEKTLNKLDVNSPLAKAKGLSLHSNQ